MLEPDLEVDGPTRPGAVAARGERGGEGHRQWAGDPSHGIAESEPRHRILEC